MIPKTLTFDLPSSDGQEAELTVKIDKQRAEIFDGESTAMISLDQLKAINNAYEQIKSMLLEGNRSLPQAGIGPLPKDWNKIQTVDQLPFEPPKTSLEALKLRDSMVSNLYVIGTPEGAYYPNHIIHGEGVDFVREVALARMFESASDAYETAKKFPNCYVYNFKEAGNYRIIIPQANGSLAYYNGTGKTSNHVNDSIQITGRESALRVAEGIEGSFLLPVTE